MSKARNPSMRHYSMKYCSTSTLDSRKDTGERKTQEIGALDSRKTQERGRHRKAELDRQSKQQL